MKWSHVISDRTPTSSEIIVSDSSFPNLIRPDAAARLLQVETQTLANQRAANRGIPWYKVGGRVFYDPNDIREAIESSRVVPSAP